ncbi:hypothetical protein WISP_105211 [Willisornis vidua]|uniref:Uncharacterized protein n=1 Tax=Willisornis vidua TaxID=1566151 RepID=A0ABQ9D2N9_9PASS|nr:hypothetical protein WISP_105211 [Willisornis vidua]
MSSWLRMFSKDNPEDTQQTEIAVAQVIPLIITKSMDLGLGIKLQTNPEISFIIFEVVAYAEENQDVPYKVLWTGNHFMVDALIQLKDEVEPVQTRVDLILPVVVERNPQAVLQDGHRWDSPTALEHCLQMRVSLALPELQCSPPLPGPTEPDPISGLTSWTGLHNPVPMALHVHPKATFDSVPSLGLVLTP